MKTSLFISNSYCYNCITIHYKILRLALNIQWLFIYFMFACNKSNVNHPFRYQIYIQDIKITTNNFQKYNIAKTHIHLSQDSFTTNNQNSQAFQTWK